MSVAVSLVWRRDRCSGAAPAARWNTHDEQIIVVGKLRALEVILLERIMHQDKWHPHHKILATDQKVLATVTEQANANDELLDAKEASRRLGYSVRWLYKNADSLPFTIREKTGQAALLQARP